MKPRAKARTGERFAWKTRNDLPTAARHVAIDLLNRQLADALDLGLQARQAHWNVKGPAFIALHDLFGEVASALNEQADDLAERAVALGGLARGTLQVVARDSRLTPYPPDTHAAAGHIAALASALARFAASTRAAIAVADEAGDAGTADLFTAQSRALDKLRWQIEAHEWSGS